MSTEYQVPGMSTRRYHTAVLVVQEKANTFANTHDATKYDTLVHTGTYKGSAWVPALRIGKYTPVPSRVRKLT